MSQNIKPEYDPIRVEAIKQTAKQFKRSPDRVRQILRGAGHNLEMLDYYRKQYKRLEKVMVAAQ